jgi:hypothetical protein
MQTRRQLLKWLLYSSLTMSTTTVTGCIQAQPQPVPFQSGEAVTPPLGCTELRANDNQGDC